MLTLTTSLRVTRYRIATGDDNVHRFGEEDVELRRALDDRRPALTTEETIADTNHQPPG